ncbi:MAG: tetratricopeptide repeat protein [Kofleriaceae bacterium]
MKSRSMAALAILMLALSSSAHAGPELDPQTRDKVRDLFERGVRHYNIGEYDQAIELLKEGYRLSAAPGFLFNIAQAYRRKGACAEALGFYRDSLRIEPDAPYRDEVTRRIAEMERCVADKPSPSPTVTIVVPQAAPERPDRVGPALRITGLATASVGVALLGAGAYFGLSARAKQDECTSSPCTANRFAALDAQARRHNKLAKILLPVGGATAVAGGIVWFVGWRRIRSETPPVIVGVTQTATTVSWTTEF